MAARGGAIRAGIRWDLGSTVLTSGLNLVGALAISYVLARRGAVAAFEPYSLAKRLAAVAMPILCLGSAAGIVHLVASELNERARAALLWSAVAAGATVMALGTALVIAWPDGIGRLVLGRFDPVLTQAIWLYCCGIAVSALVYGMYRARFRQHVANITTTIGTTLGPLLILVAAPRAWTISTVLGATGVFMVVFGVACLVRLLSGAQWPSRHLFAVAIRSLLVYSPPRIPAVVLPALSMTVGALIASRSGSTLGASYLLAGMAIIQLAAAAVGPIGVVLLPRMSEMGALGQRETLKRMTSALVYVMLAVGLIGTPLALAGTEDLVRAWLGAEFIPAFSVVRVISLALPPVVAWTLMASIADSTIRSPITGIASLVDFGVVLAGSVLGASYGPMALAWAFVAGRWVGAAILTAVVVRRHHPRVAVVRLCALGATVTLLCVALGMLLPASGNGAPLLALRLAAWIGLGMVAALAAAQVAPSALGLPRPFAPRKVAPHGLS